MLYFFPLQTVTSVLNERGFALERHRRCITFSLQFKLAKYTTLHFGGENSYFGEKKRDTGISMQKISVFHPDSVFSTPCAIHRPRDLVSRRPRVFYLANLQMYTVTLSERSIPRANI